MQKFIGDLVNGMLVGALLGMFIACITGNVPSFTVAAVTCVAIFAWKSR